jgi:hypothetical protein
MGHLFDGRAPVPGSECAHSVRRCSRSVVGTWVASREEPPIWRQARVADNGIPATPEL